MAPDPQVLDLAKLRWICDEHYFVAKRSGMLDQRKRIVDGCVVAAAVSTPISLPDLVLLTP